MNRVGRRSHRALAGLFLMLGFAVPVSSASGAAGRDPASASLTPDGLGSVRIGMSVTEAERVLGARLRPRAADQPPGCWVTVRADGHTPGIAYMVADGQIRRIDLLPGKRAGDIGDSAAERTAAGVGVGTSEHATRQAYGARLRSVPHPYSGADGGRYLILDTPGRKAGMIFEVFDGRVTQVRAGRRPELDYVEGCS